MSDKNIDAVKNIYAAFTRGDVPAILEGIDDKLVRFGVNAEPTPKVPWYLNIREKQNVPSFFQALAKEVDFTRFEQRDYAAAGDQVYCTLSYDITVKRTGKKASFESIHRFTFKNGKVVEWFGAEDTAKTIAALQ